MFLDLDSVNMFENRISVYMSCVGAILSAAILGTIDKGTAYFCVRQQEQPEQQCKTFTHLSKQWPNDTHSFIFASVC